MENTKTYSVNIKEDTLKSIMKKAFVQGIFFVSSFLFGGISFAGGISPFATGFLGGVSEAYIIATALGAASGYAVFFGFVKSLRFVCAVVLMCILKVFIEPKATGVYKTVVPLIVVAFSTFSVSLCIFISSDGDGSYLIMCLCETLVAMAFSVFTQRLFNVYTKRKKEALLLPADIVAGVFFGCVVLLSLDRLSFSGFSPARCIAYFVVMLFAVYGKESASAIISIGCGLTLGFSENQPHLMPSFILSGLVSGVCGAYGKIPVAITLVLSAALSLILKGNPETAITAISEAVLSAIIFVLVPDRLLSAVSSVIVPVSQASWNEKKGQAIHFMLKRSAKAIRDISETVTAVSSFLEKADKPSGGNISAAVKEDICTACNKYNFCWGKCEDISEKAFEEANTIVMKNERLLIEELPERLSLICRMPDKIVQSFNRAYLEYEARLVARNEIFEAKRSAARQFFCIGTLLDDAAENLCHAPEADSVQAELLAPMLKDEGFELSGICASTTPSGKSVLQLYCTHVPVIPDKEQLLEKIYEATGNLYLPPVIDEYTKNGTVLSFTQEGRFNAKYFIATHTGADEEFSGDTCRCFSDGRGCFYAVLSDGMGQGTRAAIDSVMTCNLMSRLLRAGFSPDAALEAVNCALLIKSAEETLSTLDIVKIDLETGVASFFKAGAGFSVIQKKDKTLVVEKSSFPLGIIEETAFEKSEIRLDEGDIIFIMSDGAAVIPHQRFKEIIRENRNADEKTLAKTITDEALHLSPAGKHDDITVACIKI